MKLSASLCFIFYEIEDILLGLFLFFIEKFVNLIFLKPKNHSSVSPEYAARSSVLIFAHKTLVKIDPFSAEALSTAVQFSVQIYIDAK